MELSIETYGSIPCELRRFYINGKKADVADFGKVNCVGLRRCCISGFKAEPKMDFILEKYNISATEYDEIVEQLNEKFSYGICGQCSSMGFRRR